MLEYPKLNSIVKIWNKNFGFGMAGEPIWKTAKYLNIEGENLFVEIRENTKGKSQFLSDRFISTDVTRWIPTP